MLTTKFYSLLAAALVALLPVTALAADESAAMLIANEAASDRPGAVKATPPAANTKPAEKKNTKKERQKAEKQAVTEPTQEVTEESAEETPMFIGMPNPIDSYDSYDELAEVMGFPPLYLPWIANYECTGYTSVSKDVADIRYTSFYGDSPTVVSVRSAKRRPVAAGDDAEGDPNNISGIYGYPWQTITIGQTKVHYAIISELSYAGWWETGNYAFSVHAENLNKWDFYILLQKALVEMTERLYDNNAKPPAPRLTT